MISSKAKKKEQMLFILGEFLTATSKRFHSNILKVFISKAEFISAIKKIGVVDKQPRAIYKNLENLQKSRLILYSDKNLRLSSKGLKLYKKMRAEFDTYQNILGQIKSKKISFKRTIQAKLVR